MPSPKQRNSTGTEPIDLLPPDEVLFGRSAAMSKVRSLAAKVCNIDAPVLLCGDGGTGKEAVARWIHVHSRNAAGHFVKVNCAAIPGSLLESELFGYEKGAFTGARLSKPGRVELAQKGTLFLDEIADLDSGLQSKLLQFLQDGTFSKIGGTEGKLVDTRLICATNKDLREEIDSGTFRADLFYRINVVQMRLPRLRERSEDIPVLAEYFLTLFQNRFAKPAEPLTKRCCNTCRTWIGPEIFVNFRTGLPAMFWSARKRISVRNLSLSLTEVLQEIPAGLIPFPSNSFPRTQFASGRELTSSRP